MIKIGGFVKTSFVDYPGKIASVVFTRGCNFNCGYCHNSFLINDKQGKDFLASDEIFNYLSKRRNIINAVVISGGEPTLQKDLYCFLKKIKTLGLDIKLDTNGTNPFILQKLMEEKLVDFIAMDIKAPLNKYSQVCGKTNPDLFSIRRSVELIKGYEIHHEFRTTLCRELEIRDINTIIKEFSLTSNYVIQKCRYDEILQPEDNLNNSDVLGFYENNSGFCSLRGFGFV